MDSTTTVGASVLVHPDLKEIVEQLSVLPSPDIQQVAALTHRLYRQYVRPAVDERQARRKANRWLIENVGNLVMAAEPVLAQVGQRTIWRFGAFVTSLSHSPQGPIGQVDVDANTGEVLADADIAQEMIRRGLA